MFSIGSKRQVECLELTEDGELFKTVKMEIGKDPEVVEMEEEGPPPLPAGAVAPPPTLPPHLQPGILTRTPLIHHPSTMRIDPQPAALPPAGEARLFTEMSLLLLKETTVSGRKRRVEAMQALWSKSKLSEDDQKRLLAQMSRHVEISKSLTERWKHLLVQVIRSTPGGWTIYVENAISRFSARITIFYNKFSFIALSITTEEARDVVQSLMARALRDQECFMAVSILMDLRSLYMEHDLAIQLRGVSDNVLNDVAARLPHSIALVLFRRYWAIADMVSSPSYGDTKQEEVPRAHTAIVADVVLVLQEPGFILGIRTAAWVLRHVPTDDQVMTALLEAGLLDVDLSWYDVPIDTMVILFKACVQQRCWDFLPHAHCEVWGRGELMDEMKTMVRALCAENKMDYLRNVPGNVVAKALLE